MRIESLEFRGIRVGYDGAPALYEDLNFIWPSAKVVRLDSSLPGKSTLLKLMVGLVPPQAGAYLINGQDVTAMSFEEFLPYRLRFGYGFDLGGLLNNRTLFENIALPLQYHRLESKRIQSLIERFGLGPVQHLRPFAVSGALKKATCLVRAFIMQPDILLLDEPAAGLKEQGLVGLCETIEESLAEFGLKQVIYCSDDLFLQKRLGPQIVSFEELLGPSVRKVA